MVVGIDYSMSAPAACIIDNETIRFWCATHRNFPDIPFLTTNCIDTTDMIPRAHDVAHAFVHWLYQQPAWKNLAEPQRIVHLEDYAFNATGRVFHIGEHAGILKYTLWTLGVTVVPHPPTVIKKFGTGRGNADKKLMTDAFLKEYPNAKTWIPTFFPRTKPTASVAKSPLADIADAYWIAKYAEKQTSHLIAK